MWKFAAQRASIHLIAAQRQLRWVGHATNSLLGLLRGLRMPDRPNQRFKDHISRVRPTDVKAAMSDDSAGMGQYLQKCSEGTRTTESGQRRSAASATPDGPKCRSAAQSSLHLAVNPPNSTASSSTSNSKDNCQSCVKYSWSKYTYKTANYNESNASKRGCVAYHSLWTRLTSAVFVCPIKLSIYLSLYLSHSVYCILLPQCNSCTTAHSSR